VTTLPAPIISPDCTDETVAAIKAGRKTQFRVPFVDQPTGPVCILNCLSRRHLAKIAPLQPGAVVVFVGPSYQARVRITQSRAQRVQEITEVDAWAEGVTEEQANQHWHDGPQPVHAYLLDVWDKIHGAGSWELNPWVWAYTFEVIP